jgi:hypothetical protein
MRLLKRMFNHPAPAMAVAATALVGLACSDFTTSTSSPRPEASLAPGPDYAAQFDATAKPMFTTVDGTTAFRTSTTIAYWSSSFTDPTNGVTYPYTMVGTSPFAGNGQTTIPTVIIPFNFVFSDGTVMNGSGDVALTLASPIFSDYRYPLSGNDRTQYGDAIQRAQFNKVGTRYHVRLGAPMLLPTQTIAVPASQGFAFVNSRGVLVGLIDISWFSSKLYNAINSLHVSSQTVPIVLTHNTFTWIGIPKNCCVLGYHGATSSVNGNGDQQVQTYIYSAFITPRSFPFFDTPGNGLGDIHALSHEVSEWYDDPFINNYVQPWLTPTAPQYGCTALMETGDPVVGYWFPLRDNPQAGANGVWHPEDEVYFSWFARQSPSIAYNGLYTYMGTFTSPAQGC